MADLRVFDYYNAPEPEEYESYPGALRLAGPYPAPVALDLPREDRVTIEHEPAYVGIEASGRLYLVSESDFRKLTA